MKVVNAYKKSKYSHQKFPSFRNETTTKNQELSLSNLASSKGQNYLVLKLFRMTIWIFLRYNCFPLKHDEVIKKNQY